MKNRLLLILAFFLTVSYVNAEKPVKLGYVNLAYVINLLPDMKKVEADFKAFEDQVRAQVQLKITEYQNKYKSFEEGEATMTDAVKNQKLAELQQLQADFEKFNVDTQNSLAAKQIELFAPIYAKVNKSIEAVAKENKFTHVLNADGNNVFIILYAEKEYDISDLVLKKLGIDPVEAKKALERAAAQKAATQNVGKGVNRPAQQARTQNKKTN